MGSNFRILPKHITLEKLILLLFVVFSSTHLQAQVFQKVTVTNDLNIDRSEVIAIQRSLLHTTVKKHAKKAFRIKREGTDSYLPTQWYDSDFDGVEDQVLLHVNIPAGSILSYDIVLDSTRGASSSMVKTAVFKHNGQIYWENESVVFRTPERSKSKPSAFDFGIKPSAQALESQLKKYKNKELPFQSLVSDVSHSLGLGATAVLKDNVLEFAEKIEKLEILAAGPIRTVFLLYYPTWGSQKIGEIKRISIDKSALFISVDVFMTQPSKALGYSIVAEGVLSQAKLTTDSRYYHLQTRKGEQELVQTVFFPYENPKDVQTFSADPALGTHTLFSYKPKDRFTFAVAYQLIPKTSAAAFKEWEQTVKNFELCRSNPLKVALKLPRE
ncbi:DUF4861 family protein [Flavobacterium sp.]|uniref:DUF4861 family protein n=1 Tax=Flavobacterium sp. TaxID=239 RepID=UPI002632D328|nr:DUF4861 family protein [Flavobacterium sp.]